MVITRFHTRQDKLYYGLHGYPMRSISKNVIMIVSWFLEISIRTFKVEELFTMGPSNIGLLLASVCIVIYLINYGK